MTLIEMLNQGNVFNLVSMGVIFLLMIIMISALGRGVMGKATAEKEEQPAAAAGRTQNDVITAVITAAINEYRKTNK